MATQSISLDAVCLQIEREFVHPARRIVLPARLGDDVVASHETILVDGDTKEAGMVIFDESQLHPARRRQSPLHLRQIVTAIAARPGNDVNNAPVPPLLSEALVVVLVGGE